MKHPLSISKACFGRQPQPLPHPMRNEGVNYDPEIQFKTEMIAKFFVIRTKFFTST